MALDTKAFNTAFRRFLLSSILIALSGCLGNIVDSVIVGHLIGEDGVSAINLAKPVVQLMFSMSLLLASGAGMLIGIELGKQEHDRAGFTFCLSIIGCIAFGLIMTICGVFFTAPIAHWLCANEQLYAGTHAYLRPMMLGAPMYMLAWGMATLVGVDGSPRLCSVAILVDNAVNLCLDIVFIQWLNLGIEGSSIATVIGHVVGIGIMCRHFFYKDNHLKWRMSGEWWPQTGAILSQGLPLALASICLTALLYSANSIVLRSLGTVGIFAFAVCMNLLQIYNMFLSGASRTLQSLGAIQVGKGDNEMFLLVIRKSFRFITIAMLVTCVTIWLFPEYVTRFFGADEQHLIDAGAHALRIFAFSFIPYCYLYVLMVVYKLYGYHAISLFISLALSLMVIPVLWLMARYDPNYLWYGYLIAYMIVALIVFIWHKAGKITFALRVLGVLLCLVMVAPTEAKIRTEFGDSTKTHVFTLSADLMTRGEYIQGAVPNHNETMAAFVVERTRLILNYKQRYLEVQVIPEHLGVWGTTGGGAFNLREAWAQTEVKGFLAKLGRQTLSYDDERIIGSDDWSMTSPYHDALKIGYEGFGHKIHLIGAYCQNNANTLGGTSYYDGAQPYKNMEVLWYHYDFKRWFSGSLLFINTGLQSHVELPGGKLEKKTHYQQLAGTYWRFRYDGQKDWWIDADASFYYQFGKTEHNLPLRAWMVAVEAKAQANRWLQFNAGYFHLSGDENYTVAPIGEIGMQQFKHDHSFNLLYGSKHVFYGAMDFFYLQSFYGGYSPGLQDAHAAAKFTYQDMFDFKATYHALATTVDIYSASSRFLGHELELEANYTPAPWVTISASYTFMQGTKTMEIVKRATDRNQSHWVYLMVTFTPTFVKVRF